MKKLLKFLISNIVNHPREIVIEEEEKDNLLGLKIKVNPEDLKIIIGKKGRTIKAIRNLLRLKANKQGKRVNLLLEE
jgi:predicted RNA-binding protein YlqC (UPF0109 family)